MRAPGDVGEALVDENRLDQRREIVEHVDSGIAEPLVLLEMTADEDQIGAKLARPPSRHSAVPPEGLRLVRSREHDPATDCNWLPAQRRVEQLFYRRVKGVEIGVEDGGSRFHPRTVLVLPGPKSATGGLGHENIKRTSASAVKQAYRRESRNWMPGNGGKRPLVWSVTRILRCRTSP